MLVTEIIFLLRSEAVSHRLPDSATGSLAVSETNRSRFDDFAPNGLHFETTVYISKAYFWSRSHFVAESITLVK